MRVNQFYRPDYADLTNSAKMRYPMNLPPETALGLAGVVSFYRYEASVIARSFVPDRWC